MSNDGQPEDETIDWRPTTSARRIKSLMEQVTGTIHQLILHPGHCLTLTTYSYRPLQASSRTNSMSVFPASDTAPYPRSLLLPNKPVVGWLRDALIDFRPSGSWSTGRASRPFQLREVDERGRGHHKARQGLRQCTVSGEKFDALGGRSGTLPILSGCITQPTFSNRSFWSCGTVWRRILD